MAPPFDYPSAPHVRRHGPRSYADYASFRDWLRDEFSFRCVYCLLRERWVPGGFHLDHFVPVAAYPEAVMDYDNLLYCCVTCNLAKGYSEVPDPTRTLSADTVSVQDDGSLLASTPEAEYLVECLGLNGPRYRHVRRLWMRVVAACASNPDLLGDILGYPDDLPDLSTRRPPGGNTRPAGLAASHYARRARGELPDTY
ncbi:MAG: HNH endonuclease [Zavarzinella sp.]|nr:HNH endonuclease [Zavarzinella sp.]